MFRFNKAKALVTAFGVMAVLTCSARANAATIFLLGTDAIGLHADKEFINPIFDQMANFDAKKLLVVKDGASVNYTAGNVAITFITRATLNSGYSLAGFTGVYVDSPSTCCSDPGGSLNATAQTSLQNFVTLGGSLGVGDYAGSDFWDPILGFDGETGVTSGKNGVIGEDPGVSTASGLAFGFKPLYFEGNFVHQTYSPTFWASKGYFALQTDGAATARRGDWVTIASGFTEPGTTVPEPASLTLVGFGLAGMAARRRRKLASAQ